MSSCLEPSLPHQKIWRLGHLKPLNSQQMSTPQMVVKILHRAKQSLESFDPKNIP